jgi:hypothetical protein
MLVDRVRASATDEVRHAEIMLRLVSGHALPALDLPPPRAREVFDIALENAREGCVRETFAALLALRQSTAATDPLVAGAMATIARDEVKHAELSWEIAEWLEGRLDDDDRRAVHDARRRTIAELRSELEQHCVPPDAALGLPDARAQVALLDALVRHFA